MFRLFIFSNKYCHTLSLIKANMLFLFQSSVVQSSIKSKIIKNYIKVGLECCDSREQEDIMQSFKCVIYYIITNLHQVEEKYGISD